MRPFDKPSYEFGPFRLDAAEYVLLREGHVISLSPKLFETLLVLVENSGHVVDKDELYKRVWHDVVVEETNLTKNISILRKILSEGDAEGSFIETVPKRGYRFVVPVRKSGYEDSENGSKPVASLDKTSSVLPFAISKPHASRETARQPEFQPLAETDEPIAHSTPKLVSKPSGIHVARPKHAFAALWGIAVLLIAGVGFGLYKGVLRKEPTISFASAQMSRLTRSGRVVRAAISGDAKWLVYVETDHDHQSLWLKQVAVHGSNTQIIAPADVWYLGVAISPDGNYVYYTVADRDARTGTLYQVPVLGGTPRKLFTGIYSSVAFSSDAKQIAYFYWIDDEDRLMVANTDGTGQRQLLARRGNEFLVYNGSGPSWSPDGKTIVTTIGNFTPQQLMTVAVVSPDNGAITPFSQQKFPKIDDIAWLPDGLGILMTASDQFGPAGSKIWHISYPSGNAKKITNDLNSYTTISLSADSDSLATVQTETLGNLWIASMNELAQASQITTGTNFTGFPSWTPDGKVVYSSNSGDNFDLYLLDPREGKPKQLTANSGNNNYPVVSPDGRYVVFSSDRSGVLCLWRIDIDGSNPRQLTHQTSWLPSFAPDSRTIVYETQVNKSTLWSISIEGGEPRQLTQNQSGQAVFSPNGTRIACLYSEGLNSPLRISIIPATGGPPVKIFPQPSGFTTPIRWTPDGKAIMYGITRRGVTNLWVQPIEGGEPKQLTNFTSDLIYSYEVSRDGKQLVFSRGTRSSDVVLFSGIKR